MRHQQRDHERNMRRGSYGEARNVRQDQQQQTREGREDRWPFAGENFSDDSQERGFGQADRHDHTYGESYRGSDGSRDRESQRSFGRQGRGSADYDVNRSYSSGREDFGSNSRVAGGWNESSQRRQQRSDFYGKGPKGYKRSDERIKEEVHETLTWNNEVDASEIEVEVKEGEVTLTGSVSDRRMKRLAEELIEDISGVNDVVNQLKFKKETTAEKH